VATPPPIRILLVDDHPLLMDGVRTWLETYEAIEVVGQASSAEEALVRIDGLAPNLILVDIGLPDMDGLEFTRRVTETYPDIKVVVLTVYDNSEYVRRALQVGAWGYLLKSAPSEELAAAIEAIRQGRKCFSQAVQEQIIGGFVTEEKRVSTSALTPRQSQIVAEVARGKTSKHIAAELGLGYRTVERHRYAGMKRLGLHSVAEVTQYALARGLI
jgi:DNA-binding NarL/FixJ family response regulator